MLVGRRREVEWLTRAARTAAGGTPVLAVVGGEAGVGKTALATEVARRAAAAGQQVLWAAGHEGLSVPYLGITTALGPLTEPEPLVPDRPGSDPSWGDARLAWLHRAETVLLGAARRQPIVLVVDDVQWLDPASLDVLAHLATSAAHAAARAPTSLLTVVVHRTPVLDERPRRILDRLRHEPIADTRVLARLDDDAIEEVVAADLPGAPAPALVRAVVAGAGGNPFLARSLVRLAAERGALDVRRGVVELAAGTELVAAPHELDAAVEARLQSCAASELELLRLAAFVGEPCTVGELAVVSGLAETEVDGRLQGACDGELVELRGDEVRFAHPQIRHVLAHGPRGAARRRLHLQVADGLERLGSSVAPGRVLRHLVAAGSAVPADRVGSWARRAGRDALGVGAWADAAWALEVALDRAPPEAAPERADLLIDAAWASFHDDDPTAALGHARAAVELARAFGDLARWGGALAPLVRAGGTSAGLTVDELREWVDDFLAAAGSHEPALHAELLGALAEMLAAAGRAGEAARAADDARRTLPPDAGEFARYRVGFAQGLVHLYALDLAPARTALDRAADVARRTPDGRQGAGARVRLALVEALAGGDPERWFTDEARGTPPRPRSAEGSLLDAARAAAAVARGDLDRAGERAAEAEAGHRRSGYAFGAVLAGPTAAQVRALRGDVDGAGAALDRLEAATGVRTFRWRALVDLVAGRGEAVAASLRARPWPRPADRVDLRSSPSVAASAEVAVALGDAALASAASGALAVAHERGLRLVVGWTALVSRLVGECRRVAGDVDGARRWLALALDEARDLPLERAQVRLAQARLEVGDPGRAAALAGEALAELDRIGAVALLAPARQLAGAGPSPGTRVIVFTDLVDSTRSNVRIGDVRWAEVLDVHDRVVDRRLRLHAGVAFKHTGDGIAAWFADASDAVGFASGVLDDLARASAELDDVTLLARAGLSAGEPIGRGDDLFGLCVVTAGRLCDLADPGRILVSDDVARLLGSAGTRLRPLGPVALKGLPDPVPVHEVRAASPPVPVP